MKVLFITTILPIEPKSGGEIVSKLFMNSLEELGYNVEVLGYLRKGENEASLPSNMRLVKNIVIESSSSLVFTLKNLIKSLIRKRPFSSQKFVTPEYIKLIKNIISQKKHQIIIIDHFQMGWVLEYIPNNINIISIGHNIESDLYQQLTNNAQNKVIKLIYEMEAKKMLKLEENIVKRSDRILTLTEANKYRYSELFSHSSDKITSVCIPPYEIPSICNSKENKKWDIGIIGSWTWKSNMQGLEWFIESVYPLLPKDIRIAIAGKGADHLKGKYSNIEYLGYVESANDFMQLSRVIAIPSTLGDGIQIKSIESISLGLPIVATPFALRSIEDLPSYVRVATLPEDFKEELVFAIGSNKSYRNEGLNWSVERRKKFNDILSKL